MQRVVTQINSGVLTKRKAAAIAEINNAVDAGDQTRLSIALQEPLAELTDVQEENSAEYLDTLATRKAATGEPLTREQIQTSVVDANKLAAFCRGVLSADAGTFAELLSVNQDPLSLPALDPAATELYRTALLAAIQANGGRSVSVGTQILYVFLLFDQGSQFYLLVV
jgi:hypothetical protein